MDTRAFCDRRIFLVGTVIGASSLLLQGEIAFAKEEKKEEDVGPAEDLMREHGGLNRILLIYEEGLRRIKGNLDVQPDVLKKSATIIRTFIENYHEKLEEEFIFPRMKKAGKLISLVEVLEKQHKAGRKLTGTIEKLATQTAIKVESDRQKLIYALEAFIRMYRPHESREDTILFPEFHKMMSEKQYDELGEQFEDREHKLFGQAGFEGVVVQIENLEKAYDIYDLSKFTPAT
jgi:hemerythrin-like domain-containing protein